MSKRFVSIWFRHLRTDWFIRRRPELKGSPFVLASPDHGRIIITALNISASAEGIYEGMAVADARAIFSSLIVLDDRPGLSKKLLAGIAEWCIRFSPAVAVDEPDGLLLDVSGCAHLWHGEKEYLTEIFKRLRNFGYDTRIAIADTIGAAWAVARFGTGPVIVEPGAQAAALLALPASALRIDPSTFDRLEKLGLREIKNFIHMPRPSLRRRFGTALLQRLDQALGCEEEFFIPVQPLQPYHERVPSIEPIVTATGIEIALQRLLTAACNRLQKEGKGLCIAIFTSYRVDGQIEKIQIGTNRPSCNTKHLYKLFENKISSVEPALGIELFTLDALKVEDLPAAQETLWDAEGGVADVELAELLDRIAGKVGNDHIHRYIPDEHYWPERSFRSANSVHKTLQSEWKFARPRPIQMLFSPHPVEVTAPIPDYPPMMFRYKGKLHKIMKADGPERIEQEWWLQQGQHRDYYIVEDEEGKRYWLFRSGHYDVDKTYQWFLHGFFA